MKDIKFSTRDEFKREKIADNLIKLIKADFQTSPMVVDGKWGSGNDLTPKNWTIQNLTLC